MELSGSEPIPPTPKRKRSANWELAEKALLKECIKDYITDIENKAVDTNTTKSKQKAWQLLHKRFNELNLRTRTLPEIKQQWRTMKLEAKKSVSDYKKSCKLTGGGEKPPSPDYNTQFILSMIPQEFKEDENVYDSDGKLTEVKSIMEPEIQTAPSNDNDVKMNDDVEQGSLTNIMMDEQTKEQNDEKVVQRKNRKLKFSGKKEVKSDQSKIPERDRVLIECLKKESALKVLHMTEAHEWAREAHEWARREHLVRLQNVELENKILLSKLEK